MSNVAGSEDTTIAVEKAAPTGFADDVARAEAIPSRGRIRILLNPSSGAKVGLSTNAASEEDVRRVAAAHGLGDEVIVTESEEHGIAAAQAAADEGYDVVVAAGGDGTIAAIAGALAGRDTALGILPLGSLMNIARSLGIPRDLDAAAAAIATGPIRAIDVGEANGVPFMEAGSVGLNAAMFAEADRIDAGDLRAVGPALRLLVKFPPSRMTLRLDDRIVATRALTVIVSNGPYMGLGFTVAPEADIGDGKLDVIVYSRFTRMELVRHFAGIAFGRQRYSPKATTYRSSTVHIESGRPLPCAADSRDLGTTPVTFRALPGALRVIVPADPA